METSRSSAGGKIVANRRKERIAATPYDRPPPPSPLKSPNSWFSGVVVPSALAIASGAGKILSSIFSESSSSSSSDDDEDYASEDDIDNNLPEIPCNQENTLNEKNVTSSEMMMQYRQESRLSVWKSETKKIIEQLIMKETFSREEHDRLIKVIDSRVIDWSMDSGEKSSYAGSPRNKLDHENADSFDKAVQEAKRWFQEKKADLSSGIELLSQVETGGGSPEDVARSYMMTRPSWESSSENQRSFASGSCDVEEELRRVRSRATEDTLSSPLTKTDHAEESSHSDLIENYTSNMNIINVEGNCVLLSEAYMEIPTLTETTTSGDLVLYETEIAASGDLSGDLVLYKERSLDIAQSSAMVLYEERSLDIAQPSAMEKRVGKKQGRKAMKYNTRRRGKR